MANKRKITTGANDRPVDETIAQTGAGLPDDTGQAPEPREGSLRRARASLGAKEPRPDSKGNPEAVPDGTPGSGENTCRRCSGTGRIDGDVCPECGGSGRVATPLGGG